MEVKKIIIKEPTKNKGCQYIKILNSVNNTLYSYYNGEYVDTATKNTFNKASFKEYLKEIRVPKKYINEI